MVTEVPTATKVLFPNSTSQKLELVPGEVALSKDDPLSVDLTMFPEVPTATNFPPEEEDEEDVVVVLSSVVVELSSEVLSLSVVVSLSVVEEDVLLFLAHEITVRLKRKKERIMSGFFI